MYRELIQVCVAYELNLALISYVVFYKTAVNVPQFEHLGIALVLLIKPFDSGRSCYCHFRVNSQVKVCEQIRT